MNIITKKIQQNLLEATDMKKFISELIDEINKGTYWEDAILDVEKKLKTTLTMSDFTKLEKEFKKKTGKYMHDYQVA